LRHPSVVTGRVVEINQKESRFFAGETGHDASNASMLAEAWHACEHQVGRRRPVDAAPVADGAEQKVERPSSTQFRRIEDRIQ